MSMLLTCVTVPRTLGGRPHSVLSHTSRHLLQRNDVTALMHAISGGNLEIIEMIVKKRARVYFPDSNGQTPLIRGALYGNVDVVKLLIRAGADPRDAQKDGSTALHFAAAKGHVDVVRELLDDPAQKPDLPKGDGATPLWLAASGGHGEVVSMLAAKGADVNAKCGGWSAIAAAAMSGHAGAVAALCAAGARLDERDEMGSTLLMTACIDGDEGAVDALLAGMDAEALEEKDDEGQTALFVAAFSGHAELVRRLWAAGSSPASARQDGHTPLTAAARWGHAGVVGAVLSDPPSASGSIEVPPAPSPNTRGPKGRTALYFAAEQGYGEIVDLLLTRGADAAAADDAGRTAAMAACEDGNTGIVRALVQADGEAHLRSANDGSTALWVAAHHGRLDTARFLMRVGADISVAVGCQPEHTTARRPSQIGLREQPPDVSATEGASAVARTPAEEAAVRGHAEVAKVIAEWPGGAGARHELLVLVELVATGRAKYGGPPLSSRQELFAQSAASVANAMVSTALAGRAAEAVAATAEGNAVAGDDDRTAPPGLASALRDAVAERSAAMQAAYSVVTAGVAVHALGRQVKPEHLDVLKRIVKFL